MYANHKKIGEGRVVRTTPGSYSAFDGQDIGMDSGSPVDDSYAPPFAFTGGMEKVTSSSSEWQRGCALFALQSPGCRNSSPQSRHPRQLFNSLPST